MSPPGAWWRLLTMPILAALAAGIGVFATGGPVTRSVVIALTAGVVTWLLVRALTVEVDPWPPEPETGFAHGRVPQLWEISGFESALQRPEYLGRRAIRAVREIAVPVLLRRAIDLKAPQDADRARDLLGSRNFELLTDPDHGAVSRADLVQLVDRVTRLATATGDGLRPVRIDPRLLPHRGRRSLRALIGARSSRRSTGGSADHSGSGPAAPAAATSAAATSAAATSTAAPTTEKDRS
ncbi:hypothetical protein ABLG96_15790 [Nakamurella sp. A5-74]|uniref:DUF4129 domain-containing protein n=1 Tax=Nakamurella sp. A5-74 TaxID=3158264 RepID=A0AAU8DLN8_9ACTN